MKRLKKENEWIGTILAFMIIPISGFAIDVYVPSFPQMVKDLHATPSDIRLTLSIFLISYGVSQLFVGSIVDSFGRYKIALVSLLVFVLSNIAIVVTKSIEVIFVMRALQGLVISLIMVAKRTLFIDIYTGDKRKKYTSLLSVVWSTAPVVAPFVGGYLQSFIGWEANFYFLALYGSVMLVLELIYSGETIAAYKPFHLKTILNTYREFLSAKDFSIGVLVLGLSYSMVIIFGMSAPFIIEHVFHYSPVITGYASLCSGVSLLTGGMLSRMLIDKSFYKKLKLGNLIQFGVALLMFMYGVFYAGYFNIFSLLIFVVLLHFMAGFMYNIYLTYCFMRFPAYAGTASGVTSGGSYVVVSIVSSALVSLINIHDQRSFAIIYIVLSVAITVALLSLKKETVANHAA